MTQKDIYPDNTATYKRLEQISASTEYSPMFMPGVLLYR